MDNEIILSRYEAFEILKLIEKYRRHNFLDGELNSVYERITRFIVEGTE